MIFNYSKKNQFTTNLSVGSDKLELVEETKLLGTYLTNVLNWNRNTRELVIKGYKRMQLLNRAAGFTSNIQDLKNVYMKRITKNNC